MQQDELPDGHILQITEHELDENVDIVDLSEDEEEDDELTEEDNFLTRIPLLDEEE
jgi:hypothetical protein